MVGNIDMETMWVATCDVGTKKMDSHVLIFSECKDRDVEHGVNVGSPFT